MRKYSIAPGLQAIATHWVVRNENMGCQMWEQGVSLEGGSQLYPNQRLGINRPLSTPNTHKVLVEVCALGAHTHISSGSSV